MNAKQAREIIFNYENDLTDNKSADRDLSQQAKGYLAALEGEEMKALVEALEFYGKRDWNGPGGEALLRYRVAIGEKG